MEELEVSLERWRGVEAALNRDEYFEALKNSFGAYSEESDENSDALARDILSSFTQYHAARSAVIDERLSVDRNNTLFLNELKESAVLGGSYEPSQTVAPDIEAMKHALGELREKNEKWAQEEYEILGDVIEELRDRQRKLLDLALKEGAMKAPRVVAALGLIGEQIDGWNEIREQVPYRDPDAFHAICTEILRRYVTDLQGGRLVVTPYVQKNFDAIMGCLARQEVPFVWGDTGSGKTELARLAAFKHSGKPPLVLRCYEGMDSSEIFGYLGLSAEGVGKLGQLPDEIDAAVAEWEATHIDTTTELRDAAVRQITEAALRRQSVTVSEYVLGAAYIAAKEGRVLISDEVNFMPPPLFAKFNDVLTKRVGEYLDIQEDGATPIKIENGYGIILTGNVNVGTSSKYKNRKEFDPAQLDRVTPIQHDYPPQAVSGSLYQIERADEKELYAIVVSSLLDDDGNLYAPVRSLEKLWSLAQYARVTQLAFANRIGKQSAFAFKSGGVSVQIETNVLVSPRGLSRLLEEWRAEGFRYELDHYVFKHLISRAFKNEDRDYLYQLGQMFGFFRSDGWFSESSDETSGAQELSLPKNRAPQREFVYCRDVVRAVFGSAPVREIWPDREIANRMEENALIGATMREQATLAQIQNGTSALGASLLQDLGEPPAELLAQYPTFKIVIERLQQVGKR